MTPPQEPRLSRRGSAPLTEGGNESFDVRGFGRIVKTQAWVIVAVVALGLGLSLVYAFVKPAEYKTDFVVQVGIAGDTWLHNPIVTEEQCRSIWFLNKVAAGFGTEYDGRELKNMVEPELVLTPTKGLTRHVKITVKGRTPDECYALAVKVGELLVASDKDYYDRTIAVYDAYLKDLRKVAALLAEGKGGGTKPPGSELNFVPIPPNDQDWSEEYAGGSRVLPLFERDTTYEENPFLIPSVALLEQVYITTYVKARSPIFSQPTLVNIPPARPTHPEGRGKISTVVIGTLCALALGLTLAALSYRFQQNRVLK